jgi:hypothetical protein
MELSDLVFQQLIDEATLELGVFAFKNAEDFSNRKSNY